MAIGPVQLIVLGFDHPEFHGEIIEELERLRESDTVRVIDALAVHKDADGEFEVVHLSNLTRDEAVELGSKVAALIGLGIEGEEGMEEGAVLGAQAAADGIQVFDDDDAWDVLEEIPNDSAAALLLIEHHWAVPLRDAIARAGGFRISDGFISPLDLIAVGLLSADSLKVSPALQRKLGADYLERWDAVRGGDAAAGTDFSLAVVVLDLQKGMLAALMSDAVAARLLDSAEKAPSGPQRALRLAELDARLTQAVWSELATGGDIPSLRRELQRDHVNRLANQLLRPQSQTRADVRSLRRMQAKALAKQLEAAARRGGLNEATRAHLDDSADTLNQALAAKLERQGV